MGQKFLKTNITTYHIQTKIFCTHTKIGVQKVPSFIAYTLVGKKEKENVVGRYQVSTSVRAATFATAHTTSTYMQNDEDIIMEKKRI